MSVYQTLNFVPQKFDKTSASFLSSGKMLANSEEAADIASAMVSDLCDALQNGKTWPRKKPACPGLRAALRSAGQGSGQK